MKNQNQTKPAKLTTTKVARREYVAEIDGRFFRISRHLERPTGYQWDMHAITQCEEFTAAPGQIWEDIYEGHAEGWATKRDALRDLEGNPALYVEMWDDVVRKAFYRKFPNTYTGEQPTAKHAGWQWFAIQAKCEKAERKITAAYVAKLAEYTQTSHGYTIKFAGRTLPNNATKADATHRAEGFRLGAMERNQMDEQIANPKPEISSNTWDSMPRI